MAKSVIKKTLPEKIFDIFNIVILTLAAILTLAPMLHVLAGSLSEGSAIINYKVMLWPVGFQLDDYKMVFANDAFWISFRNTMFILIVGTTINMVMTVLTAYPLSKSYLRGRKYLMLGIVISMVFVAPMIPTYLVVKQFGMVDTLWSQIIPYAISPFNLVLCMTFFRTIPEELYEAARIDGMPEYKILMKIAVPLSISMMVTIGLFYAVTRWNAYGPAVMYITSQTRKPLQLYLYSLIASSTESVMTSYDSTQQNLTPQGIQMATIIASTIPIIIVYPFIQKYFIKGAMIGSLKE